MFKGFTESKSWLTSFFNTGKTDEQPNPGDYNVDKRGRGSEKRTYSNQSHSAPAAVNISVNQPHLDLLSKACQLSIGSAGFQSIRPRTKSHSAQSFRRSNVICHLSDHRDISRLTTPEIQRRSSPIKSRKIYGQVSTTSLNSSSESIKRERRHETKQTKLLRSNDVFQVNVSCLDNKRRRSTITIDLSLSSDTKSNTSPTKKTSPRSQSHVRCIEEQNDSYSRNYSKFVEKSMEIQLQQPQKKLMRNNYENEIFHKSMHSLFKNEIKSKSKSKKECQYGRLKLSMQYFGMSRQLRVILVRADDLPCSSGTVYAKLKLVVNKTSFDQKVKKTKIYCNAPIFNEEVYFDKINLDISYDAVLRVRLYCKSYKLALAKCLGEVIIPLDEYNLCLDTTLWGYLQPKRKDKSIVTLQTSELEVTSEDRSIEVITINSVHPSPNIRRARSFKRSSSMPLVAVWQVHE